MLSPCQSIPCAGSSLIRVRCPSNYKLYNQERQRNKFREEDDVELIWSVKVVPSMRHKLTVGRKLIRLSGLHSSLSFTSSSVSSEEQNLL